MAEDHDYRLWTKESLVKRIKALEAEKIFFEQQQQQQQRQNAQPDTPPQLGNVPPSPSPPQPAAASGVEVGSSPEDAATSPEKKKKKGDDRDASRYSTRYIALKLAYLGRNYNGLEYQPSGNLPAIEEELWKALMTTRLVFPEPGRRPEEVDFKVCDYSKCGRTDRGVSAFGQVVALRVKSNKPVRKTIRAAVLSEDVDAAEPVDAADASSQIQSAKGGEEEEGAQPRRDEEQDQEEEHDDETPYPADKELQYCKLLNAVLPNDIRVLAWCPNPPPGFSARHSCYERQYRYYFTQPCFSPLPSRLDGKLAYTEPGGTHKEGYLDIEAMREAARKFEGEHDFRNFCKIDPSKQISNYKRIIREASVVEVPEAASALPYLDRPDFRPDGSEGLERLPKVYYFHVRGSAFLWHQIRHMVAMLFLVGQRVEKPSIVSDLLDVEKYPRKPAYPMASDTPLVLWDCLYGGRGPLLPDGSTPGELEWMYAGADGGFSAELYGRRGLLTELWADWRGRKMDELLCGQLLQRAVTLVEDPKRQAENKTAILGDLGPQPTKVGKTPSKKMFGGDDRYKLVGNYVPLAKRPLMATPDEVNDQWARSKGFASAAEIREDKEWRTTMKARKAAAAVANCGTAGP